LPTIIAKIDHLAAGLPMLRLPDGTLTAGDPDALSVAQVHDVIVAGTDGIWRKGSEADWEPNVKIGTIERVDGSAALLQTPHGVLFRTIPAGMSVHVGNTVTYDGRTDILNVFSGDTVRPSLLDDDFNVESIRSTPRAMDWSEFAGFPDLLQEAKDLVAVHTDQPARAELSRLGVNPIRGILFDGPPGTGKTFLAQIMASKSRATFYLVTTAALGGRLVSESEQRLQRIYTDAATQELSIVFIDEIDTLTGHRESDQNSGSRLVNVFLTNMDGVQAPDNVITIGTTNLLGSIDHALRRPGRFDRQLTFTYPDVDDRDAILRSRTHVTSGEIDYRAIAERTESWTAADLGAIWQHAGELTVISGRSAIRNDYFLIGFERAAAARKKRLEDLR